MENVNVTVALDENYAPHAAALIASIFENAKDKNISIYLLIDGVKDITKGKLTKLVEGFHGKAHIVEGNIEDFYTSAHLSRAAYLRLKIPELLPDNVSKVLYLDVDLLVKCDITELFNLDLENKPIGGALDLGIMTSRKSLKEKRDTFKFDVLRYFNSGVLLMDLNKWRENDFSNKLLELVKTNDFRHHDQDALNILFYNNWYEIPLKYNVIPPVFELPLKVLFSDYRKKAVDAVKNAKIIHYAGGHKPWHYKNTVMLNDYYYMMLGKTEFTIEVKNERVFRKYRSLFRTLWGKFWTSVF